MKISDRIALFAKYKNMSIRSLEQTIGASNGLISKAISKTTDISSQWVTKILIAYPEINSTWLLTGEGEMINNIEVQRKLLQKAMSEPMDLDFFGLNKKKLTALIKVGDKYYSANTLDELKDIVTQIEKTK